MTIANGTDLYVDVPCNTRATLCLPRRSCHFSVKSPPYVVDGIEVEGRIHSQWAFFVR